MKKYGKKWRKLQAEKKLEQERIAAKAGEPFSKARHRKILCFHYGGRPGGIIAGYCYSQLEKVSETECACWECGKRFPIKKYDQMEKLVKHLSNQGCVVDMKIIQRLSKGLEPVYYRRLSETEVEIVETETREDAAIETV